MNLVLSETHTLYFEFSISLIPNGKFLRVVAKRMSTVSLNIPKHLAIFNYVKIVLLTREIISMTLEGKEMVFTRITWGELEGANSERGETTGFPLCAKFQFFYQIMLISVKFILSKDFAAIHVLVFLLCALIFGGKRHQHNFHFVRHVCFGRVNIA